MPITISDTKVQELEEKLEPLDMTNVESAMTYTLSQAIREGSSVTTQKINGWIDGDEMCAISAALLAVKARHLL